MQIQSLCKCDRLTAAAGRVAVMLKTRMGRSVFGFYFYVATQFQFWDRPATLFFVTKHLAISWKYVLCISQIHFASFSVFWFKVDNKQARKQSGPQAPIDLHMHMCVYLSVGTSSNGLVYIHPWVNYFYWL